MSTFLHRLGATSARHGVIVLLAWLALLAAGGVGVWQAGLNLSNNFVIPGTEAQEGLDVLSQRFPEMDGVAAQVVVSSGDGTPIVDHKASVGQLVADLAAIRNVSSATDPWSPMLSSPAVSTDGEYALINVQFEFQLESIDPAAVAALEDVASTAPTLGLNAVVGGQIYQMTSVPLSLLELVGVGVALIILVVTFRAVLPATLPIISALLGVGVAMCGVLIIARWVDISTTTPTLAVMIGLAVGIDYCLFIVSRHRAQLAEGWDVTESAAVANATAGGAVLFAAMTVIVALCGLLVSGIPFLAIMGLCAAAAVAVAALVAITAIPALLGLMGEALRPRAARKAPALSEAASASPDTTPDADQVAVATDEVAIATHQDAQREDGRPRQWEKSPEAHDSRGAPDPTPAHATSAENEEKGTVPSPTPTVDPRHGAASRWWVRVVTAKPVVTIALVILAIVAMTIPAGDLRLSLPDNGVEAVGTPARDTYDLVEAEFGPGANAPLLIIGDIIQSTDPLGIVDELSPLVAATPGIDSIQLATPNRNADLGVIVAIPTGSTDSIETEDAVRALREAAPRWEEQTGVTNIRVTGMTAAKIDITQRLSDALVPFALIVVGLALVILTIVFRSVWVPMTATIGYLLSVAAAFGVTSAVFSWGWFTAPLGIHNSGPVICFMPILVLGVLFGLAMDYEVFLVTRMREDWSHGTEAKRAVTTGFVASARVVVAAALIMVSVFMGFIPDGSFYVQPIALGLAVGVAVDAFLVRMTLIPAVMVLLGERAWWAPTWLSRLLPHVDIEGAAMDHHTEHLAWTSANGPAAVRVKNLQVKDGEHIVADLENLVVRPGQIAQLEGSAQAVRAVLAVLGGAMRPDQGIVVVQDNDVRDRGAWVRAHVGLLVRASYISESVREMHRSARWVACLDCPIRPEDVDLLLDATVRTGGALILGTRAEAHGLSAQMRVCVNDGQSAAPGILVIDEAGAVNSHAHA